jgi:hypothetical protein
MRVTFAYPHTAADGTTYGPDESAELDDSEARQLIRDGVARVAVASGTRDPQAGDPSSADPAPTAKGGSRPSKTSGGEN